MAKKVKALRLSNIEGDPLCIVLGFLPGVSHRAVSKTFASHAPRITALVFRGRDGDALPRAFYQGIERFGHLVRLDLRQIAIDSFHFLGGVAIKELYLEGSVGTGVINSDSLEVLDMSNTEFRVGEVPNLQELTTRECPYAQVFPPSITSLDCSYTVTPLWLHGLSLTYLDVSGKVLPSLEFLGLLPLKVVFLTSCTRDTDEPWLLDAALLPFCVKLSVSHTAIYTEGSLPRLEVLDMQECPNIDDVPDAPRLTTVNCSDNYITEEFIQGLAALLFLTELMAAGCNEDEALDLSGLRLKYLAVPDTRLFGQAPSHGFPPGIEVVRFSEQDLDEFDERVLGLPDDTQVYVFGFDVFDYEDPEESGLEGAWKSVPTLTLAELRAR